jgi:hypothetical protein
MEDGWAWVSLSAYSDNLSSHEIRDLLPGSGASRTNPHLASVRFNGGGSGTSLADLLAELDAYLSSHRGELRARLPEADFQLRIGWSPEPPQESVVVSSMLLAALAELHADVLIDTFGEVDEGEGSQE